MIELIKPLFHLQESEINVLLYIYRTKYETYTANFIAEELYLTSVRANQILFKLLKEGLLVREKSISDSRKMEWKYRPVDQKGDRITLFVKLLNDAFNEKLADLIAFFEDEDQYENPQKQ